LAFSRIVDRPIGREFYVLPYCKFVVRHIALERVSSLQNRWPLRPLPALTRLRVRCGSGEMADGDNRRPEQPIGSDANE
jgi:hypothetical protein